MKSGIDALNDLKSGLGAMVEAAAPPATTPNTSQVVTLLQEANTGISINLPGISIEILVKYGELIHAFQKGLTALAGRNADKAVSELRGLAKQALGQTSKAS